MIKKRFIKNFFKKSLSLAMAVLMVLSCWVWGAPEHNHVLAAQHDAEDVYISLSDIESINSGLLNQISAGSTTINTTSGRYFSDDSADKVTNAANIYNNLLWSGQAKEAGKIEKGLEGLQSFSIYYPETVLMADGRTNPTFGISLLKDAAGSGCDAVKLAHFGTSVSHTKGLGLEHYWYGSQKGADGKIYFLNAYYGGNQLCGYTEADKKLVSKLNYYTGDKGEWFWLANKAVYSGKVNEDNYYEKIIPEVKTCLGSDGEKECEDISDEKKAILSVTVNVPIYVIKTDTLLTAYGQIDGVKEKITDNPSKYTPASVEKFKDLVNALYAANPNDYGNDFDGDTEEKVKACANEIKNAVNNWNTWLNGGGLVEVKEVKWNDGDGDPLETVYCGNNHTPDYIGTTPTKDPDPTGYYDAGDKGWQYTYTFNNSWSTATTADSATNRKIETHTANFDRITNFYVVTYKFPGTDKANEIHTYWLDPSGKAYIPKDEIPNFTGRSSVTEGHYNNSFYWSPKLDLKAENNQIESDMTYIECIGAPEVHEYGDWTPVEGEEATCNKKGKEKHTCEICNYSEYRDADPTSEHVLSQVGHYQAATCTKEGVIDYWQCLVCGTYFSDEEGKTAIIKNETVDQTIISVTGHNFDYSNPIPKEDDNNNHYLQCFNCDHKIIDTHIFIKSGSSTATCVTPGSIKYECACGETKVDEDNKIDPNSHVNTITQNKKSATCTEPGYTGDKYCYDCNKTFVTGESTSALGHSFTKYESNGDATCTVAGTETSKCDRCDAIDTRPDADSVLGHEWTDTERYLKSTANCTDDEVYYKECSRCNISSKGETNGTWVKTGTKWNHNFNGDYVSDNNGKHTQKCKNAGCNETGNEQSCTYSAWTTDNATTHSRTCTACKHTPTAEHNWTAWTPVDENAATASKMTRKCTVCGRTETTDCTNYELISHTDADCDNAELITYKCKDCGRIYEVTGESATGHNFTGAYYKYDANMDRHQQLCANGCGTYGVGTTAGEWADCKWSYENIEAGKHTATCVCDNSEEQVCSGGKATCTAKAECQFCHKAYGEKSDHSFTGTVVKLEGDFHAYRCEFCKDETIYGVGAEKDKTEACSGGSATCTTLATCNVCGDTHGQLDADAHKWGAPVPNNDEAHTHTYTCEYNAEHTKVEKCNPAVAEVVKPTCEDAGYTVQKCTACNVTWNTDPTVALGHEWGAWVNNGNGTHTKTCVRVGCCYGENGDAKTETASCTKENATVVVTAPTCTEQGFSTYTCKDCGYVWVADKVSVKDHDYTKKIYSEEYLFDKKNCTQGNIYFYACSSCGKNGKIEEDLNKYTNLTFEADKPLGHKWVDIPNDNYKIDNATCTTAAKYYKYCSTCLAQSEETFTSGGALGHKWVQPEGEELKNYLLNEGDCETDAVYYYMCETCKVSSEGRKADGETWTLTSDKPGRHGKMIPVAGVVGDCENDTILAHYYCEDCGKKFKDANGNEAFVGATVIKAPGHSWVKYKAVDATCETDGHDAYDMCSVCNVVKGSTVKYPKTGHNFTADAGYYVDEVNNYHAYYCANAKCIPATDNNGEAIKDAKGRSVYNKAYGAVVDGVQVKYSVTDNGDGTVTVSGGFKCSFDDSTVTTVNGVHSHNDVCVCGNSISVIYTDETPETIAPTCVDNGYKLHVCPDCSAEWKTDMVEPNGHTWSTTGTSNGDGTHSLHCTVDGCNYKKDTVRCEGGTATCEKQAECDICHGAYGDTLPHTLSDSGWSYNNDAKCGRDGTESQNCSVCGKTVTRTKAGSALNHVYLPEYIYDISDWANKPADFNLKIKEPTCKENGLAINYCTNDGCGHYNTKIVKLSSIYHKITETTIAGTCTTGAKTIKSCSVCDYTETITSQASDHKWTETSREVPDCTNSGAIYFYCTACGETAKLSSFTVDFTESDYVMFMGMEVNISGIKALGHQWGNLEIEKAPTCSREGRGKHTCNVCKKTEIVDIAPIEGAHIIGHKNSTLKKVPASAPTCVLSGNREYYECMSCPYSQNANDEYYLKPLNHKDGDGDGRCDTCYDPMGNTSVIKDDCICHKTGFSAFIYKILRVFWKLFKMKQTCECGVAHY